MSLIILKKPIDGQEPNYRAWSDSLAREPDVLLVLLYLDDEEISSHEKNDP